MKRYHKKVIKNQNIKKIKINASNNDNLQKKIKTCKNSILTEYLRINI